VRRLLWIALGCWLAWLLWMSRREMLDDALIHLRYASFFHQQHRISFDGVHSGYGTSSLLYVVVLAALRSVTLSPLLPKAVSLEGYVCLLGVFVRLTRRTPYAWAALLVLIGPYAVRWLTDGMETSLVCALTVLLAIALRRASSPIALFVLALALSLMRVDLTLLIGFGAGLMLLERQWRRAIALALGSLISLCTIWLTMGHILPDTALAKEGAPFMEVLFSAAHILGSTFSFGVGLLVLWLTISIAAWRTPMKGTERKQLIVANLLSPTLILLAAAKGQQMQGIRYVLWAMLFSTVWNLLSLPRPNCSRSTPLLAFAAVLAGCWVFEMPSALHVFEGRSATLERMADAHLERLGPGSGLAGDVGFISYFSNTTICDIDGLVNGRAAAQLSFEKRARACMSDRPSFLFVSGPQFGFLKKVMHLQDAEWLECGNVAFSNAGSEDRHWLLVLRTTYPQGCPTHL
jgi:hypothetical protein